MADCDASSGAVSDSRLAKCDEESELYKTWMGLDEQSEMMKMKEENQLRGG